MKTITQPYNSNYQKRKSSIPKWNDILYRMIRFFFLVECDSIFTGAESIIQQLLCLETKVDYVRGLFPVVLVFLFRGRESHNLESDIWSPTKITLAEAKLG